MIRRRSLRLFDMFEPDLEAGDVFFDLFDEGQVLSQLIKALVRLDLRPIDRRRRASGDQNRIEPVILGPAQVHAGTSFDLDRLQDQNSKALLAQIADHPAFVAAACLDADTGDLSLTEFDSKTPPTFHQCVLDLPASGRTVNGHIELGFRCIDPRRCGAPASSSSTPPC